MHSGSNRGYRCFLFAYADGRGVVLMTNSDNGDALQGEVVRTLAQLYGWPDFAPVERVPVSVKPELLDRFAGAWILNDGQPLVIRSGGDRLFVQFPRQPVHEMVPLSDREFFSKTADVVTSFSVTELGVVTAAKFRSGGFERAGPRAEETRSKSLIATVERQAQRITAQKPLPESEPAVRKLLAGLANGKPDYAALGAELADVTRRSLTWQQQELVDLGELKSLVFVRVGPRGEDVFNADFANGQRAVEILLDEAGLIERSVIRSR
jgi:hypothetical protein